MSKFKAPYDIIELENRVDERGGLFEILRFEDYDVPGSGQLYTFSIRPGKRRGDHYHEHKEEWFTCVYGEAIILLEDKEGNQETVILNADEPKIVYCAPYTVHALYNDQPETAVMVSYGSHQHDPEDPDTYYKFIETE